MTTSENDDVGQRRPTLGEYLFESARQQQRYFHSSRVDVQEDEHIGYLFWEELTGGGGVVFSWSHRWRAGQHPQAPCRKGRWRTSWASRLYSPCGRCAYKAGTGWGRRIRSPACRSHTLWSSSLNHLGLHRRPLWADAGWGRCAELCVFAPPLWAARPSGSDWAWGDTAACESAPDMEVVALGLDRHRPQNWPYPIETREAEKCRPRSEIWDSFPWSAFVQRVHWKLLPY